MAVVAPHQRYILIVLSRKSSIDSIQTIMDIFTCSMLLTTTSVSLHHPSSVVPGYAPKGARGPL
jgi:hypothetical protein